MPGPGSRTKKSVDMTSKPKLERKTSCESQGYRGKLFQFFTHESGLENDSTLKRGDFETVLSHMLERLKMPKNKFVTQLFRRCVMEGDEELKAKMHHMVQQSVRAAIPKGHTKVGPTEFKAVLVDLAAKVYCRLLIGGQDVMSGRTAAIVASLMICGGYSEDAYKKAMERLKHVKTISRKDFSKFIINEMVRFQCPFPTRYPVTRSVRFLALAGTDESIVEKVQRLSKYVAGIKVKRKKSKPKRPDAVTHALSLGPSRSTTVQKKVTSDRKMYDRLLRVRAIGDGKKKKQTRLKKQWFEDIFSETPFTSLVMEGVMASFHTFSNNNIMDKNSFADLTMFFLSTAFRRMVKGRKHKTFDHLDAKAVIQLLTGSKETQGQRHLMDYFNAEQAEMKKKWESKIGKNQKVRKGLDEEGFGNFMARAWAHEADCGDPARAHARFFGMLLILCYEDAVVLALKQHRLELDRAHRKEAADEISLLPGMEAIKLEATKEANWRDYEYGLDLDFGDAGSDSDEGDDDDAKLPSIEEPASEPISSSASLKKKKKRRKKKRNLKPKEEDSWDYRHHVSNSKNDHAYCGAYRSSFDTIKTQTLRPDGSSTIQKRGKSGRKLSLPTINNRYCSPNRVKSSAKRGKQPRQLNSAIQGNIADKPTRTPNRPEASEDDGRDSPEPGNNGMLRAESPPGSGNEDHDESLEPDNF